MIIRLFKERADINNIRINYEFRTFDGSLVAVGKNSIKEGASFTYEGKEYCYPKAIHMLETVTKQIHLKVPILSKAKKTPGFWITESERVVAEYYNEAATCSQKWIFKKNMIFKVFKYQGRVYTLFKVGFSNESSHYYCLYNCENVLLAVIERVMTGNDNCIAILYIEDASNTLLSIMACAEEIIFVPNVGHEDMLYDPSAGNYISLLAEEKAMFDRGFVERVKASV